ncbi:hypothetical protein HPP92_018165 [Vanilla planifolia]|uniref:Uncharacterized protein n=1 Tax=Vanilla planifolia TaxID=51239 RepID=A0A835QJG1_VANPL|nr:hypothetical protein HPP92_018165 [Vanilla planifolia]
MTTRSLSVSFQGKSFFFQTSKAKPTSRKLNSGCQKPTAMKDFQTGEQQPYLLPLSRSTESNLASKSFDCSAEGKEPILVKVRLLQNSFVSFDIIDHSHSLSLDSDCLSSGSNSSLLEPEVLPKLRTKVRGICVPARFRQETENPQKLSAVKHQPSAYTQMAFPRSPPSLPFENIKPSSSRDATTSRIRGNIIDGISNASTGNAPSIIRFASALRRTKKSERRIEDAHMLRLFHNRYLQLRFINARAESAHSTQLVKTMIACLEEWSMLDEDHEISLTGTVKALKASTLRLPVVGRAKVDIHEVKEAVDSAIVLMQAMSGSMCSLLPQAEGISSQSAELTKVTMLERTLLDQCSVLLSISAELHVKQCSLRGCILQHGRKGSLLQL